MNQNTQIKKIAEEIQYPSGGVLMIYSDGTSKYKPSEKYQQKRKEYLKINIVPKTQKTIAHNRKKLLFEQNRCISGEKLLDRLFKMHEVFDLTK